LVRGIDGTLPTRIFIRDKEAEQLKGLLRYTKAQLLELMSETEQMMLDSVLVVNDTMPKAEGRILTWENYYFDNIPSSTVLALLSKFQNDIKLSQSIVIRKFYDEMEEGFNMQVVVEPQPSVKIDTFKLEKGVKKMDVFFMGEDGVARITLPGGGGMPAGASATIFTYDDNGRLMDSFMMKDGAGEIKLKTDQIGEFRMKGVVRFRYPDKQPDKLQQDVKNLQESSVQDKSFDLNYKVINPQ